MPGIVGIISHRQAEECSNLVRSMVSSMKHESFYALGIYPVPEMGIYAGWVAHENSFGAAQPFCNERRDVVLLFSGECFVDPEARASVGQKGCRLGQATGSWLVHCYEKEGSQFFEKLNGLFSGLLHPLTHLGINVSTRGMDIDLHRTHHWQTQNLWWIITLFSFSENSQSLPFS